MPPPSATRVRAAYYLGEWDWALGATVEVNVEHLDVGDRATLLRTREEILAARGEPVDQILAEHERLLGDRADGQQHANLLAGRSAAAFADGRFREAANGWRRGGELNPRCPHRLAACGPGAPLGRRCRGGAVRPGAPRRPEHAWTDRRPQPPDRSRRAAGTGGGRGRRRAGVRLDPAPARRPRARVRTGPGGARHGAAAGSRRADRPRVRGRGARDPGPSRGAALRRATRGAHGRATHRGSVVRRGWPTPSTPELPVGRVV